MCLGHESLKGPHLCGVAEQVFASLPWPCLVWAREGGAVMVNEAFRKEFGLGGDRVGPRWMDSHLKAIEGSDEVVHRDRAGLPRRYRLSRQVLDAQPGKFDAVFLMPMPDDEAASHLPPGQGLAVLPADVSLTPRESQVLDGIMSGKLNKVIAGELEISPKTVELHRANLMAKLRVHNVVELTRAVLDTPSRNAGALPQW